MQNLTKASRELFKRHPDECSESLTALSEQCQRQKEVCVDRWVPPRSLQTNPVYISRPGQHGIASDRLLYRSPTFLRHLLNLLIECFQYELYTLSDCPIFGVH